MSSPITLNGTEFWVSDVNENPDKIKTDSFAIDGTMQRSRFPDKKKAVLSFSHISAADYQAIKAMVDSGNEIAYINTNSIVPGGVLSFSGIPDDSLDAYSLKGSSPRAPFKLTIRES